MMILTFCDRVEKSSDIQLPIIALPPDSCTHSGGKKM